MSLRDPLTTWSVAGSGWNNSVMYTSEVRSPTLTTSTFALLRALGRRQKLGFCPATEPVLRALAAGKRVRGRRLDPFGHTELRRLERRLPIELTEALERAMTVLADDPARLDDVIALAALPDQVRGYERLKLRRIAEYRTQLDTALAALGV